MKTRSIALILTLLIALSLVLAACGDNGDGVSLVPPDSASPTVAAASSASPSASPTPTIPPASPTPTLPTDTKLPDVPDDNLGDTFKALAKESDTVLRGKFIEKLKEPYNQIRDANDPELPDEKEKVLEWQFILEITEAYVTPKGTTLKPGDKITVNLAYEDNYFMTNYKPVKNPAYFEPDLNQELVLFLRQDTLDKKIYYPDVKPFYFDVKEEKLFVRSNNKTEVENFESKMKLKAGEGAPVANLKKDLGVK